MERGPLTVRKDTIMTRVNGIIRVAIIVAIPILTASSCLPATSDRRLKRDIAKLGPLDGDIDLYRYRYLWDDQEYVGVMAQDLLEARPDAVVKSADGYLAVDYARLGTRLMTWQEWQAAH
jgi:hypothetical protein